MIDCIEWTKGLHKDGYGLRKYKGKTRLAHRVAYEEKHGEIPEGMCVCHTCDNPKCINPDHLFLADHSGNMQDRESKRRGVFAKLTPDDVHKIRERLPFETQRDIADDYGVHPHTISNIKRGKNWSYI